jgi:signal transduction histidine kinase
MLLLLLGIVLLVGAAYQAYRTSKAQQHTVTRVLQSYARVAAWNFEQHATRTFRDAAEPLFHPLHEPSFASGELRPYSIRVLLDNPKSLDEACEDLRDATRYGVRFLLRGSDVETTSPIPQRALQSVMNEVRAHYLATRMEDRLTGHEAMHAFALEDTAVIVLYSPKVVPRDTVLYALVMDGTRLTPLFDRVLAMGSLLPEPLLEGVATTELLIPSIELADGRGLVYGTLVDGPRVGERLLSTLGDLVIKVQILEDAEQHLILGGSPALRGPFLLALLGIAIGLLVVALSQLRREYALAQLRSDFVSSVSHELRTPLALQRIFLDMIKLGRVDTPERRAWCFDNIDRESTRLAHLVENVLHFSHAERGSIRTTTERALLAPLIGDILHAFAPLAATSNATIQAQLAPDISAPVDAGALRQVLMNILENAVKYGPASQRVTVQLTLANDDVARITVDDEGSGVPPEERCAVFQAYRRGAATRNTAVAGSGIGLAVVQGLVRAHGGRVYVADAPGRGARVVVELPGARRAAPAEPAGDVNGAYDAQHADADHADVA